MGGVETYLRDVVAALAAAGHAIAFWCEVDRPADRAPIALPEAVTYICAADRTTSGAVAALRRWAPDVLFAHGLQEPDTERQLLDVAPGVLLAHTYYGTCISGAKTFKSPVIVPCHRRFGWPCLLQFYPRRCGGWSPLTMTREFRRQRTRFRLLAGYRAILTLSSHMRDEYLRHGFDARQVFTVGLDEPAVAARTAAGPARGGGAPPGGPWQLLFAGRMDALKGGGHLIDALPETVRALGVPLHLTMAGDGPARVRWERRAARCTSRDPRLRIEFPGWLDRERLGRAMQRSDLLVLPSLWPEPLGLIGLEAARCGLPVAAFAVGGVPDWLHPGVNGHLADGHPPTPHGLAAAMAACLKDRPTHDALRLGARRLAPDRAFHDHVDTLARVFAQVVEDRSAPTS